MPPPTAAEKERTAQLVASLPRKEQAELLAQALLREYMHRRGFTQTLAAFDEENPRDERAIASRAIMKRLLNIPVDGRPSRLQQQQQPAAAVGADEEGRGGRRKGGPASSSSSAPTFMAEMCSYRLTKRDYAAHAKERRRLRSLCQKRAEEGRDTQELQEKLMELPEDPSDTEMRSLEAQVAARNEEEHRALHRVERFRALQKEKAAIAEKKGEGEGEGTGDEQSNSEAPSETDSERERRREARRQRRKEKQRRREERKRAKGGGKKRTKHSEDARTDSASDDDGEGGDVDSADEAYGVVGRSPAAVPAPVGSRWVPPGHTGGGTSTDPFFRPPSPFDSPQQSRRGSAERNDREDFMPPPSPAGGALRHGAAAALPERPIFDAGEGVTLMGSVGASSSAGPFALGTPGASGPAPGTAATAAAATGGRPLLSRSEITEVWQPGRGGGGGGLAAKKDLPSPHKGFGLGAGGALGVERHVDTFTPGRSGGGRVGFGFTPPPTAGGSVASSAPGGEPQPQPHAYNRSAQPLPSALTSSGKYSGQRANTTTTATSATGTKRAGAGFNASSGGGTDAGASAIQQQRQPPPPPSTGATASTQPVFRSAVDAVPGKDGMRHGFGFHKAPAAAAAAGGASDGAAQGGKKERKVTLLVD